MENLKDQIDSLLFDWILSTEKVVGARLKKFNVRVSDNTRKNIRIELVQAANREVNFYYRDSLKYVDMGARPGYRNGVPLSTRTDKKSIRKPIMNKGIFPRLSKLQGIVTGQIISKVVEDAKSTLQ